ncbi:VOC family protein [Rhizobium vallis]|uniref:VOC family protein n=1 Tax=Rhizobium vallis TaxID=634290 RepID=A0A432PNT6_9HYPH|nr:VOC family protein [Rhizobium vallis]RUM26039.1 VOC family protein [Rhizobium vallis]
MLLYVTLGTNDLYRAGQFYDAVLSALGYRRQHYSEEEVGYSADGDTRCRFWVVTPFNRRRATAGNGAMVAFAADTRAAVDAFHAAAIAAGAVDEGGPGLRPYHAHFYAAYVRDLDGNKLSAVCESPE